MVEELSKTPPSVVRETSLSPPLKTDVALSLILPYFSIDFSIDRFLLVRVFFN
jgi:hypothetical protein